MVMVIVALAFIGVALWALHRFLGPVLHPVMLMVIDGVVVLAVLLWLWRVLAPMIRSLP